MDIRPVKTRRDYEPALQRVDAIMDAAPESPEGDELDVLVTLVERYEDEHFPVEAPDPAEAIKFRMEQPGLGPKDLEQYIGPRGRVSEILNRKRSLPLRMIRSLHDGLGLPYESLMGA